MENAENIFIKIMFLQDMTPLKLIGQIAFAC